MAGGMKEEFIIEFIRLGDSVKVSAIDPVSGREVCVIVPAKGVTQKRMMELASQKLRYVLNKEKSEDNLY